MHYCDIFIESSCFNDFKMDSLKPYVYSKENSVKKMMKLPMKASGAQNETKSDVETNVKTKSDIIKPYKECESKETLMKPTELFYPDKSDPLFWCIFMAIYGEFEYFQLTNKSTNRMIDEKCRIGQYFAKNARNMKDSNVKLTIKQIQMLTSDLMTNANTTIELLTCYAIYFKRKIVVTKHETYIQIIPHNTDGSPIVIDNNHGYGLYTEDVTNIESNKFEIFNIEKPLKSISSYKVTDLRDLAERVQLNHVSNGKQDLYDALNDKLKW